MDDGASEFEQASGQAGESPRQTAKSLERRRVVIGLLGLAVVVFAGHWVWSLIGALFTLFLIFGLDDEIQAYERDWFEP